MNIFVLEDDLLQREAIAADLQRLAAANHIKIDQFTATSHRDELLAAIAGRDPQQIYFLDLEIKGVRQAGLEVAKAIRAKDNLGTIVFVTTHSEMAPVTFKYKVAALDFVDKDQSEEDFQQQLLTNLLYVRDQRQTVAEIHYFYFENKTRTVRVPFDEILYFETSEQAHKIVLFTTNQRIEFYANLNAIVRSEPELMLIQRSCAVNVNRIVSYDKSNMKLTLSDGTEFPVARRKIGKIERLLKHNAK
ncbi:response regulator transcription factor [Lapidilactobacillus bayanensis]|uniref:response regulator transcription factor n=1 Tax=Lapidilactobacillus bayanensis TaxID=2485998 RepID=UPI000F79300F|nr:response regulator transcription factor [Lapidilactobacillus bayanensis]